MFRHRKDTYYEDFRELLYRKRFRAFSSFFAFGTRLENTKEINI